METCFHTGATRRFAGYPRRVDEVAAQRVRVLADEALARADTARTELAELLAAVERLRTELTNGRSPRPQPVASPTIGVDAARLVAIEMAVAGRSRQEVEQHLRAAYGGPDTSAVLADVFGDA